jgi:hypothetical protein
VFSRASGFPWGVRYVRSISALNERVQLYFIRAVAFMDLGLLIIANSIMRTRLPPKSARGRDGEATIRSVLSDIPFIIYAVGAFLVRVRFHGGLFFIIRLISFLS